MIVYPVLGEYPTKYFIPDGVQLDCPICGNKTEYVEHDISCGDDAYRCIPCLCITDKQHIKDAIIVTEETI